jgi:hypothetical protein
MSTPSTTIIDVFADPNGRLRVNVATDEYISRETAQGLATIQAIAFASAMQGRSLHGELVALPGSRLAPTAVEYHFAEPAPVERDVSPTEP